MAHTVLIADDHPLLRDALARMLRSVEPDVVVVEAGDFDTAVAAIPFDRPTLALVDLHMPGMHALDGVRRLRRLFPALPLAVASGDDDPALMRAVLDEGAVGFLPKTEPPEALQRALRLVLAGGVYTPLKVLAARFDPVPAALTPRQLDVLRCLGRGDPNKVIARELGLTEGTVKIHIAAILRALQARNRTEAVVVARRTGILAG